MPVAGGQQKNQSPKGSMNAAVFLLPFEIMGDHMKKEQAIKIITSCAKEYHNNLENNNLLFIFGTQQKTDYFEAAFLPKNFLHLTGVELVSSSFSGSSDFYNKCLNGQLSPHDFSFAPNGTTDMKLMILPQLMKIHKSAKMIGDYNFSKSLLYTEKLAGNISACLGFVRDDKYYIPNTALKEDIRDITIKPQQRILAIYKKSILQRFYTNLSYLAKGIEASALILPQEVYKKLQKPPVEKEVPNRQVPHVKPSILAKLSQLEKKQNCHHNPPVKKKKDLER